MADLLNPSFFLYLGIIILAIAILVVFFESKLREQNHKISSMFSIVSTLAEDMNKMKYDLTNSIMIFNGGNGLPLGQNMPTFEENKTTDELINVSDDEESDEDNDEDNDSDNDSDSDSDSDSENKKLDIKVLKLNNNEEISILENEITSLDEDSNDKFNNELDDEFKNNNYDAIELVEEEYENDNQCILGENLESDSKKELKTISIDLEDHTNDLSDYKKLPLQKLKTIVYEKGLSNDTSKLKKPELLKLLGIE